MSIDRRRFFTVAGLGVLGVAGVKALGANVVGDPDKLPRLPSATPVKGKRFAMVVDMKACTEQGFAKCVEACHRTHNVPTFADKQEEVKWIWGEPFHDAFPELHHEHLVSGLAEHEFPVFCNHCDNPPCTRVCPTQATWKREDGVVMMDWHRCIGCRYCIAACPYGSRSFNWRDPRPHIAEITTEFPTRERGVVEKCNFCEERLARGQMPACAEACQGDEHPVLSFGDLDDPNSIVRQLLAVRPAIRRKPELGTEPQVYYLV
ncbi:MAG: 4Fe-4S dicluster domain-containing protein [Acidobacteria bacterium]|nr:4Fe-4S dicluster domain-containing protein [Acidobacteriota bacterium]